ncbi:MAG: hypothetical protein GEU90_18500 [Gemmatimonas sp.]|nr:hypothetical protein [Gemmatimonas sp.]
MASVFRQVTENWKLKTLAFALAVLLWVVVSSEQVTNNWIGVPLDVQVTDPDYRIASSDLPSEVEVRFSGPARDLLDLALRRPPLRLAVSDVQEPVETLALDPRMVQLPAQVAVSALEVRPAAIRLEFAAIGTRILPVQVQVTSRLGNEWALVDSITADPPEVRVRGPRDVVAGLGPVKTVPVELLPGDSSFSRLVPLDTAGLAGIDLSTLEVRVMGKLDRIVQRTIEGVGVDVGPGVFILPADVDVVLRGPRGAVENVSPAFFRVVVSISEIPSRIPRGGIPVPLRIDGLRPDVRASVNPPSVRLFPVGPQFDPLLPPSLIPFLDTLGSRRTPSE